MGQALGLKEAVAMALGGMIGGGIYTVLGVVTQITGAATWVAFLLAGIVAACAAYSYTKLNALAQAATTIFRIVGLSSLGALIILLSVLFSTRSAINATLFSAGYFAKGLLSNDFLSDRVGDSSMGGVPSPTIVVLEGLTASFTAYGSLEAITVFASLAFIIIFGGMSYLASGQRDAKMTDIWSPIPVVGITGTASLFVLLLFHLFTSQQGTFYAVVILAVAVFLVEVFYFEREFREGEIKEVNDHGSGDPWNSRCFL